MLIKISARHGSLSPETQERIREKVEKLTRIFDRVMAIEVTVDLDHRDAPSVDVMVSAEHRHDFRASYQAGELFAALDVVMEKLESQLRRYKERVQERHRNPELRRGEYPELPPLPTGENPGGSSLPAG
ncbi:MAG: ribosome-associated translation inhibitor RaiA [Thermoguttaceae bacterium]|nr:ribosome-associated translation inhibitor RaiA [Thermoguttaceae bacterium]MDW8078645.1 ribosome-associated translation inhibitor RaiA [Thermoguttaceae bacterium]